MTNSLSALLLGIVLAQAEAASDNPYRADVKESFPARVHVFEDYETEIERRWWLRGALETKDVPPSLSTNVPNKRAFRAGPTKDFDDRQGDAKRDYKAVVFNPVPGPPMGGRTRLRFRYKLSGADGFRVQIFSLSNNYHRRLDLTDMPQGRWESATVDMTQLRRPDGTGGPLSADERIDDIQFYVDPKAKLLIDDIVLYDAAAADEPPAEGAKADRFPARVIFTGWFDTGKQGAEWPGTFEIVPHEKPRTWDAAQGVVDKATGRMAIKVGLRGARPVGRDVSLRFAHRLRGGDTIDVGLVDTKTGRTWKAKPVAAADTWDASAVTLSLDEASAAGTAKDAPLVADQLEISAAPGSKLLVDDVILYEPTGP